MATDRTLHTLEPITTSLLLHHPRNQPGQCLARNAAKPSIPCHNMPAHAPHFVQLIHHRPFIHCPHRNTLLLLLLLVLNLCRHQRNLFHLNLPTGNCHPDRQLPTSPSFPQRYPQPLHHLRNDLKRNKSIAQTLVNHHAPTGFPHHGNQTVEPVQLVLRLLVAISEQRPRERDGTREPQQDNVPFRHRAPPRGHHLSRTVQPHQPRDKRRQRAPVFWVLRPPLLDKRNKRACPLGKQVQRRPPESQRSLQRYRHRGGSRVRVISRHHLPHGNGKRIHVRRGRRSTRALVEHLGSQPKQRAQHVQVPRTQLVL